MIINNTPNNEAILSNVGEIGEFRIRNSAKAFNILSSGLYANKIRAIIRELSCNAVDSHVAAGKKEVPFAVHLPTQLEPHFSIRDFGTGLSHDQVTNIYTTYFESTKTTSNEFIGALGLGSKSPFSYTDNFTVTAIKDGRKGIYSAFINEQGVPSIALMMEEETTDPAGVEIKFSVNDRYDFNKFQDEARTVYRHFSLRPEVSGPYQFDFNDVEYESRDIIPGVHSTKNCGSRAVMGNIAYPIDVPNSRGDAIFGLLDCGLEMHFGIGELDFQASREGLSYIPQTIAAIKAKLEAINAALTDVLTKEANAIENEWDRADFLCDKGYTKLWRNAVIKYVADTKFELIDMTHGAHYIRKQDFKISTQDLKQKYNISVSCFSKGRNENVCSTVKPISVYVQDPVTGDKYVETWVFAVSSRSFFVVNDTKVGAIERSKYHWRNGGVPVYRQEIKSYSSDHVMVLSPADSTKPMDIAAFTEAIHNPDESQFMKASALKQKPRAAGSSGIGQNVSILKLAERGYGGYYREKEMVWKDAGKSDEFDSTKTHYYLPLSGFEIINKHDIYVGDVKRFVNDIQTAGIGLDDITIYGVRKTDHAWVAKQSNWVNIQDHLLTCFDKVDEVKLRKIVSKELDMKKHFRYNSDIVNKVTAGSPYLDFVSEFQTNQVTSFKRDSFEHLSRVYKGTVDVQALVTSIQDELTAVKNRYPLLSSLKEYDIDSDAVAHYINLIDKGV